MAWSGCCGNNCNNQSLSLSITETISCHLNESFFPPDPGVRSVEHRHGQRSGVSGSCGNNCNNKPKSFSITETISCHLKESPFPPRSWCALRRTSRWTTWWSAWQRRGRGAFGSATPRASSPPCSLTASTRASSKAMRASSSGM